MPLRYNGCHREKGTRVKKEFINIDASTDYYDYTLTAEAALDSPKPYCRMYDDNGKRVKTFFAEWGELLGWCEFFGFVEKGNQNEG